LKSSVNDDARVSLKSIQVNNSDELFKPAEIPSDAVKSAVGVFAAASYLFNKLIYYYHTDTRKRFFHNTNEDAALATTTTKTWMNVMRINRVIIKHLVTDARKLQ
jgi:hypothetical protein